MFGELSERELEVGFDGHKLLPLQPEKCPTY